MLLEKGFVNIEAKQKRWEDLQKEEISQSLITKEALNEALVRLIITQNLAYNATK